MDGSAAKPLRVMIVAPFGPGGQGGIDRIMDQVRLALDAKEGRRLRISTATSRGSGHILWSVVLVARILLRLCGSVFGAGPDLVHVNISQRGSVIRKSVICQVAQRLKVPYVLHVHGSMFREYWGVASSPTLSLLGTAIRHAKYVVVLGGGIKDFIVDRLPSMDGRVVVLPNATPVVAAARHAPASRSVRILFLGRLGARKGVPQLVEAAASLPRDVPWELVIAGDGAVDETRAEVRRSGLADIVSVPGWLDGVQASDELAKADILVLPSFYENLPMSVVEAMAHGLAVVTTPVGVVEDIVETEVNGLLVPAGDVAALREALLRLVVDPDLRARLGRAARAFHDTHLNMDLYADRLLDVWRSASGKGQSGIRSG